MKIRALVTKPFIQKGRIYDVTEETEYGYTFTDGRGGSFGGNKKNFEVVPESETKRLDDLFKNDPVTIAVDKCNDILKELGLKVKELKIDLLNTVKTASLIYGEDGKIITYSTFEKLGEK